MKYIDADKLKAEIERRLAAYQKNFYKADNKIARLSTDGRIASLKELLPFIDSLPQHLPDFPTTDEEVEAALASIPKVELPDKYKTPDWLFKQQEQPEVDLDKFAEKIEAFQEKYKSRHLLSVAIKGSMAFMARMFYQYPNTAREWYDILPKATMDEMKRKGGKQ